MCIHGTTKNFCFILLSAFVFSDLARAQFSANLGLESQSFFYRDSSTKTTQSLNMLQIGAQQEWQTPLFASRFKLDAAGSVSGNERQAYLNLPEAFLSYRPLEQLQVGLGRRLFAWNDLDSEWKTGFFQPLGSQDPLRTMEGGLTGIHFEWHSDHFQFTIVPVSVYVPTLGPEIREKNDKLVSPSPWFRPPRDEIYLSDEVPTVIHYNLILPKGKDVVNNNGSAIRTVVGNKKEGVWIQAAWAYKPMNQLAFEYDRSLRTLSESDPHAEVNIRPNVAYHEVYGGDLGWTGQQNQIFLSYFVDSPKETEHTRGWVYQRIAPAKAWGARWNSNVTYYNGDPVAVSLSFMRINGGKTYDVDVDGSETHTLLGDRFLFTDAAKIRLSGSPIQIFRKNLKSSIQYLYDQDQKGGWFNAEFRYFPERTLALHLGADVLGITTNSPAQRDQFLNEYRSNDRLYTGISYVF
ncbi:MAG: hypothetical protein AB7O96_09840 [Pseudobdellovibrionaceae bacterium]